MAEHNFEIALALGVLSPMVSFWLLVFAGPKLGKPWAGWTAVVLGMGVPLLMATYVLFGWLGAVENGHAAELTANALRFHWADLGDVAVNVGVKLDSLTVAMYFMVTFIAFWIFFFSIGYMSGHSDEVAGQSKYHRFFAYLSLFSFSMLGLVVSSNLLFLFIFWELVGLCSYLLISNEAPSMVETVGRDCGEHQRKNRADRTQHPRRYLIDHRPRTGRGR